MEDGNTPLLLRLSEAAEMLSCSTRTVKRMVERGDLAYVLLTEDVRSIRVATKSLVDFVDKGVSQCQSTNVRAARTGTASSKSTGSATSSQQARPSRRGPRRSSEGNALKQKKDAESHAAMQKKPTVTH
ncbi:MAG: DNA-binding protein [Euryarchaeota archaeon]|nr:DNA-binding protein [Euryarchaeota archaeon]